MRSWSGSLALEARERPLELVELRRLGKPARAARRQSDVGDAVRAEREADQRAGGGKPTRDRRGREPARTAAAELGRVVGEHPRVDVVERLAPALEPRGEWLEVEPVGAAGRLTESGGGEKPLDRGARVHGPRFSPRTGRSLQGGRYEDAGSSSASNE